MELLIAWESSGRSLKLEVDSLSVVRMIRDDQDALNSNADFVKNIHAILQHN